MTRLSGPGGGEGRQQAVHGMPMQHEEQSVDAAAGAPALTANRGAVVLGRPACLPLPRQLLTCSIAVGLLRPTNDVHTCTWCHRNMTAQ